MPMLLYSARNAMFCICTEVYLSALIPDAFRIFHVLAQFGVINCHVACSHLGLNAQTQWLFQWYGGSGHLGNIASLVAIYCTIYVFPCSIILLCYLIGFFGLVGFLVRFFTVWNHGFNHAAAVCETILDASYFSFADYISFCLWSQLIERC